MNKSSVSAQDVLKELNESIKQSTDDAEVKKKSSIGEKLEL